MSELWLPTATSSQPGQSETGADRGLCTAQVRERRRGACKTTRMSSELESIVLLKPCVCSHRYEHYVKMVAQELSQLEEWDTATGTADADKGQYEVRRKNMLAAQRHESVLTCSKIKVSKLPWKNLKMLISSLF